jgi:hypothetical protein
VFDESPDPLVLFTGNASNGDVIAMLCFADGAYALTRNKQYLSDMRWPRERLDDCITQFLKLVFDEIESPVPTENES